jgi:hypothetical protein
MNTMQTINLQETIHLDAHAHESSISPSQDEQVKLIFEFLAKDTNHRNSLETDKIFEETRTHSVDEKSYESESAEGFQQGANQVLIKDYQGILQEDYLPDTEEELINFTAALNRSAQKSFLATYWKIGRCILDFYKKEYGADKLRMFVSVRGKPSTGRGKLMA